MGADLAGIPPKEFNLFMVWVPKPATPSHWGSLVLLLFSCHSLHSLRGRGSSWSVCTALPGGSVCTAVSGGSVSAHTGLRVLRKAGAQRIANKRSSFPYLDFTIFSAHLVKGCNLCCVCPFTSHYILNERRDETYSLFKASKIGLINTSN